MKSDKELLVLGRTVRRLRKVLGLSQEELADRSGLHANYIGGIERGERNLGLLNLLRLARALESSPAELLACYDAETGSE